MSDMEEVRRPRRMSGIEEDQQHGKKSGIKKPRRSGKKSDIEESRRSERQCVEGSMLVAAVDFGTTYSGYAFKFKGDNLNKISVKSWNEDTKGQCPPSEKAPTCLLLAPDGTFEAFGYKAEDRYSELTNEGEHVGWHYFKHFKMMLHNREGLSKETTLRDDQGFDVPAKLIFTHCIKYMKDDLLGLIKQKRVQKAVSEEDIKWVLTVPAIWDESSKQFMREAAVEAGIENDRLVLALEPEAASVFIKEVSVERVVSGDDEVSLTSFSPDTKYMIVDLGGGTVDVTVRQVLADRTLREVTKASGGAWGGLKVNDRYMKFIEELLGPKILEEFRISYSADSLDLNREIEQKKRSLECDTSGRVTINLPPSLLDLYEHKRGKSLSDFIKSSGRYCDKVELKFNKMRIDNSITFDMFRPSVESILSHVEELLVDPVTEGVKNIILVGGFSNSKIIHKTVKEKFSDYRVVIPQEAGLAVLKGAVLYGENPLIVSERISRYTYGTKQLRYFMKHEDPPGLKTMINGHPYCKDVFNTLARVGQSFLVGQKVVTEVSPITADMTQMPVIFYKSNNSEQRYVDGDCQKLGSIIVDMPDTTGGLDRIVEVSLTFGDTELHAEGRDMSSGKKVSVNIDLLNNI